MALKLRAKPRKVEEAEMDITPMIDCTFLLLIFFLVTSKMDSSAKVNLPQARFGVAAVEKNAVIITLRLGAAGETEVFKADGPIPSALIAGNGADQETEVTAFVEDEGRTKKKTNVIIKADQSLKYREVARIMAAASKAEVEKLFVGVMEQR